MEVSRNFDRQKKTRFRKPKPYQPYFYGAYSNFFGTSENFSPVLGYFYAFPV